MGEPDILHSIGHTQMCTFDDQSAWYRKFMGKIISADENIVIPSSRFGTYCETVLKPMMTYLEGAQVRWDHGKTVVCHGGLSPAPHDKLVDIIPKRNEKGFLPKCKRPLNDILVATEVLSEMGGSVQPCQEPSQESFKKKLVIVGHRPTTLSVPRYTKNVTGQWLIETDTQYTDRTKHHSCTAFNVYRDFWSRYTFVYNGQRLTAELYSWDNQPRTLLARANADRDFTDEREIVAYQGRVVSEGMYKSYSVYVSCKPPPPKTFDTHAGIHLARERMGRVLDTTTKGTYTHYTWGDVEGSVDFLRGCQQLLDGMGLSRAQYVSIGDVVGKPETHDRQGSNTSDATTVAFANEAAVKIMGNRDLNKLRILPEYLYWVANGQPVIEEKNNLNSLTFPYLTVAGIEDEKRLPGTWLHDRETLRPEESILDKYEQRA